VSIFNSTKINTNAASGDAFGRLRVSSPTSLFDAQLTYDLQPLLFEQVTANGGGGTATIAHDATNRMALMTFSSAQTGGKAFMQSYEHFRYRAGHSQLIYITGILGAGVANVVKFMGYSDGTEGIELQRSGASTVQLVLYSTTTNGNQTIAQASWNIDAFAGAGPSGKTLDLTKAQILVIDFQALYVGRVRVGFDIDGVVYWAHEFKHANLIAYPYFKTANLPIRAGMTCTGTVNATMNFVCATVQTENGETSREGFHFSQDASVTAASGAKTHLLSIQPKTTFNSITNRTKFILDSVDIIATGGNPVHFDICIGDVITGTTTFLDVNATYSAMQYNILGTTSGAPSIIVYSGHIPATNVSKGAISQSITMKYPITLDVAGAARALGRVTVLVTGLGGTSTVEGVINWTEVR
jgi:hypothetical protein